MYMQLERIYKGSLIKASTPYSFSQYEWFLTPKKEYIGIEKAVIQKRDILLLEVFLQKIEEHQLTMTESEKWWHSFLFETKLLDNQILYTPASYCRFIHFQFSESFLHKDEWKEALSAFFDKKIEVIWETTTNGIIIELLPDHKTDEIIAFSDIVDTTASDFYTNVKLYVGAYSSFHEGLQSLYQWEKKCFHLSLISRKKSSIHTFEQAIPYLVTGQLEDELVIQIKQLFIPVLEDEQELLQSIKVFIENNLNVSLTAKKLFMHRNSLQYRIDKFIERTGIDIKNFQGALAAYLAIIIFETEQ